MVRLEIIARYLYIHFVNKIVITTQVNVVFKKLYTVLYPQSCKRVLNGSVLKTDIATQVQQSSSGVEVV